MTSGRDDPVVLLPVTPASRHGGQIVTGIVALAILTFAVGYGIGGGGHTGSQLATASGVTASAGSTEPTLPPTGAVLFAPEQVRGDLRTAVTGAAPGGAWALCAIDVGPECQPLIPAPAAKSTVSALAPVPLASPQLVTLDQAWTKRVVVGVAGTHLLIASGELPNSDTPLGAIIVEVDAQPGGSPLFVTPVRVRDAGVYFDLGLLRPSRYLVFMVSIATVPGASATTPAPDFNILDQRFEPVVSELAFVAWPTGIDIPATGQP